MAVTTATATTAAEAAADDRTTEAGGLAANAAIEFMSMSAGLTIGKKVKLSSERSSCQFQLKLFFFIYQFRSNILMSVTVPSSIISRLMNFILISFAMYLFL